MDKDISNYKLGSNVRLAINDGTCIVLDINRGKFYSLTPVATMIVQELADGKAFSQIVDLLHAKFPIPLQDLQRDATAFLNRMEEAGLCIKVQDW
jgi:hypothetical protein